MSDGGRPRVLVIGSGIAGLTTALEAARAGSAVTVATKDVVDEANTRYAQGGIAGVMFADDSTDDHARDTLVAGAGLADPEAVRVLVEEGPERIRDLIAEGVAFDRTDDGSYVKGLEAAHSYPRVLHAGGDATGAAIEAALVGAVRAAGVTVVEHAFLADLVVEQGRVTGGRFIVGDETETETETETTISADAVVLATGGAGQLYSHTTNPAIATGDGIAAAIRAGAAVADLEFVQFHPTVLAAGEPFLVSEAVRGEGAVLLDDHGVRFTVGAHPDAELAPRDVVARAIAAAMAAQDERPVLLDATAIEAGRPGFLARRFPTIDAAVRARGLDWTNEPIPVTPAAHYLMGGVATDLDGRTSLPGLFAVGEVARTGVHGANRLASNSLLEGAVFGARAARAIERDGVNPATISARTAAAPVVSEPPSGTAPLSSRGASADSASAFSRAALQDLLWTHAGLVRDETGLGAAAAVLAQWRRSSAPPRSVREREDANLLLVGEAVVAAASARRSSVGAHRRLDEAATSSSDAQTLQRIPAGASC